MSNAEQVNSFNVARRAGKDDRKRLEGLNGVALLGDTFGISIVSNADIVGVDLASADETAIIAARYPELTEVSVVRALQHARREKKSVTDYAEVGIQKTVELFEDYSGRVALGVPLTEAGAARIAPDRQYMAGAFTEIVGSDIVLPVRSEPFMTVGIIDSETDDSTLNLLADTAASIIWPNGTNAPDALEKVFLFDPEAYPLSVATPDQAPQYFGE